MKILVSAALNGQSTPFLPCSDSSACWSPRGAPELPAFSSSL